MPFILIAIACCMEIFFRLDTIECLPLFVAELVLLVACSFVACGIQESRRKMPKPGIGTIEQKLFSRFHTSSVAEAKIISQVRGGLRRHYARQADRSDFFRAYHGGLLKHHWYLRFLPVVNAAFSS